MKKNICKYASILLTFILVGVLFSQSHRITDSDSTQYPLKQTGMVQLYNKEGSVFIESWNKDSVKIRTVKRVRAESRESAIEHLAGLHVIQKLHREKIKIQVRDQSDNSQFQLFDFFDRIFWEESSWSRGEVDIHLTVPEKIRLKIRQRKGNITLSGINGSLSLSVNRGRIDITDCHLNDSQVELRDGRIYLSGIQSSDTWLSLCEKGRMHIEESCFEDAKFHSGSARLRFTDVISESCLIQSDNGDIHFESVPENEGVITIRSKHGDVFFQLNDHGNAAIQVKTVKGTLISDMLENMDIIRNRNNKLYTTTLGDGKDKILIQTYSGDIDIF